MASRKPCITCGVREKVPGRHRCVWCLLPTLPAEEQVRQADYRRKVNTEREGHVYRARVPAEEWPDGERWCSGCQMFVPLDYVRGSMCKGHASKSAHRSHVARTYDDFTGEDYEALLRLQGGRCYICRQVPRSRRLAVDHDHVTLRVRGLLCSDDEWGCNHRFLGALEGKAGNDIDRMLEMARRLVSYLEDYPLDRLRRQRGEAPLPRKAPPAPKPPEPDIGPPPF